MGEQSESAAFLAVLSENDQRAVVRVVQSAQLFGDGWLQRQSDGTLRARSTSHVVITEAPPSDSGSDDG